MKVLIRGVNEGNVDKISEYFVNLGLSPAPLYKSLSENSDQVTIECKEDQFFELKNALAGICEVILMEKKKSPPLPTLSLISLFLVSYFKEPGNRGCFFCLYKGVVIANYQK